MNPEIFTSAPSYTTKLELVDQPIMYSGSSFYVAPNRGCTMYYDPHAMAFPGSPDSLMSTMSPSTPSQQAPGRDPPMMIASSSSSTINSTSSASYLSLPQSLPVSDAFYPEFLRYSKESFEHPGRKKRRCDKNDEDDHEDEDADAEKEDKSLSTAEVRRQIHIQSEQKRRAQIKDGFEDLRNELPACINKKMSKVALLHRTVQHLRHLKNTQTTLLAEMERLAQENEQLRKFQQSVLQKQAFDNMYSMGNL